MLATLFRMKRAGRRVALVLIGGPEMSGLDGLHTYRIADDVPWREVETLTLQGTKQ
jgi:hypothetical protein